MANIILRNIHVRRYIRITFRYCFHSLNLRLLRSFPVLVSNVIGGISHLQNSIPKTSSHFGIGQTKCQSDQKRRYEILRPFRGFNNKSYYLRFFFFCYIVQVKAHP